MSRRWSDTRSIEATLKGRQCDCCGSTLGVCHSWCDELESHTERPQSLSIMQALMSVVAAYMILGTLIGLLIIWGAGHPSEDVSFVVGMLLLSAYLIAGECGK